ncbi:MAG: DUF1343 domain-containing protein [Bacteroidales bacterium]|nr:DUF1343 domain-containing protein [Bacteroidales bacterium]
MFYYFNKNNFILKCLIIAFFILFFKLNIKSQTFTELNDNNLTNIDIKTGAERTDLYFPLLKNKKIAIVANQTSMIAGVHLVDSLLSAGFTIVHIFCPEHGFRGEAEAGESIDNNIDTKTGLPVISLHGKNRKPAKKDLQGIDIVIFDIQDVGVRFYTYISTLSYMMEACAENNISLLVLDRPNPNGYYIDGPVLKPEQKSFLGLHPIPLVHGLTVAEYALMVNGEGWLVNGIKCDLKIVEVSGYNHSYFYSLPVKPSPNLPVMAAVYLYPSLGLFEGTVMSIGRGTDFPFQLIGHPDLKQGEFTFTPQSMKGMSSHPLYEGKVCYGYYLKDFAEIYIRNIKQIYLFWLLETYRLLKDKTEFFTPAFDKHSGDPQLKKDIIAGKSEAEIRSRWTEDLNNYKKIRKKYLLYPDFEK